MKRATAISVFLMVLFWANLAFGDTVLFGTVGLKDSKGKFCPGQMIRVYLVRNSIKVPYLDLAKLEKLPRLERIVAINNAQLEFFKSFREKACEPDFIAAETVTSRYGTFTFKAINPGRYFVVVTFPSMIMGRKVAWEVAVDLTKSAYNFVHLRPYNLALPVVVRKSYR